MGRSFTIPGLEILAMPVQDPERSSRDLMTGGPIPYPSMADSQQGNLGEQTNPTIIFAPGSDASRYSPGSTLDSFSRFEYFRLGSVLLRPSALIGYMWESNLFAVPGRFRDHSLTVQPTIEAFIPITSNGIRMDYSLAFRDYKNYDLRHKFQQEFNADSQFDISPILNVALRDHFARSSTDAREFGPGRETIFSDSMFTRNEVEAQLNWSMTEANSLGLLSSWNRITFDEPDPRTANPLYDYDQYRFGGYYRRELTSRTALFASGVYFRMPTDDPRDIASSDGFETTGGIESYLTPLIRGQFAVGYRGEHYENAAGQDFRGAIFRGNLQKEFSENMRIGLALSRSTNPSGFQSNAYYLTHGVGVTYAHDLGKSLFLTISPGYQRNSYPLLLESGAGVPSNLVGIRNRVDNLYDLYVNARYRYSEWISVNFHFDVMRRNSYLADFRFTNYRAGLSLLLGSRGITMGRAPY